MVCPITGRESYFCETGKINESMGLALLQEDSWRNIAIALIDGELIGGYTALRKVHTSDACLQQQRNPRIGTISPIQRSWEVVTMRSTGLFCLFIGILLTAVPLPSQNVNPMHPGRNSRSETPITR